MRSVEAVFRRHCARRPRARPPRCRRRRPRHWETASRRARRARPIRCRGRAPGRPRRDRPGRAVLGAGKGIAGDDLAEIGARHDHALVHVERHPGGIDPPQQIGRRLAGADARFDETEDAFALGRGHACRRKQLEAVGRQMQRLADQEGGLGDRVGGAVGEHELCRIEPRHRIADEIEHGDEFDGTRASCWALLRRPLLRRADDSDGGHGFV